MSSGHVQLWEMDLKEGRAPKNWCFWTVMLEKTLESPLDRKEIKSVTLKGNQSWVFIGRTDAEDEIPIVWPPDAKIQLIRKDSDDGKDWGWEKGETENEMARWHHWLNGREFEQTPQDSEGQGSLACCSPWDGRPNLAGEQQQQVTESCHYTAEINTTWSVNNT